MLDESVQITSSIVEEFPGCFIVALEGELDSSNAQDFMKYVQNMIENNGLVYLVSDFSKLRYINSTGLGVLLRISKMLNAKKGSFIIVGPNEEVFEIIEIVGANKLLSIYKTKEEAINSLKG